MQVSLGFGFGRSVYELEPDQGAEAIMWEMIGQTFAIIGMSVAKISLGLFLLRLVVTKWHRVAIWTVMLSLFACSCATAAVLWTQCTPVQGIYDVRVRPTAKCDVPITPIATLLGGKLAMNLRPDKADPQAQSGVLLPTSSLPSSQPLSSGAST